MSTKPTLVALDLGFGYTDACTDDCYIREPSVIGTAEQIKYTANLVGKDTASAGIHLTDPSGQAYFVGQLALKQSSLSWTLLDRSRNASEASLLLAHAAFSELGVEGPIHLVTGLPVDHYADKDALVNLLKGSHTIRRAGQPSRLVEVTDVIVALQPFGPLFDVIFNHEGKVQNPSVAKGRNGVIDIGTFTTDWVVYDNGEYVESLSGSTDVAMGAIHHRLIRVIDETYGLKLGSIHEADMALRQGYVKQRGQRHPIGELAEPIIASTSRVILSRIINQWKETDQELDNIFIAGGGASTIGPYLAGRFPNYVTLPDSEKSVVTGYFKYGLFKYPTLRAPAKAKPKQRRKAASKAKSNGATE